MKEIKGIKAVAQKIADAPKQYGIVAKIDTDSGRSYTLAMQIFRKDSKAIAQSNLHDIIAIINEYFNAPEQ